MKMTENNEVVLTKEGYDDVVRAAFKRGYVTAGLTYASIETTPTSVELEAQHAYNLIKK